MTAEPRFRHRPYQEIQGYRYFGEDGLPNLVGQFVAMHQHIGERAQPQTQLTGLHLCRPGSVRGQIELTFLNAVLWAQ